MAASGEQRSEEDTDRNWTLHEMFHVVGDQLLPRDVRVLKFLYSGVFDESLEAKIKDGFTFFLALEREGRVDDSHFKYIINALRMIIRHDLIPLVTLRRRKPVEPDPVDLYLQETSKKKKVEVPCWKRTPPYYDYRSQAGTSTSSETSTPAPRPPTEVRYGLLEAPRKSLYCVRKKGSKRVKTTERGDELPAKRPALEGASKNSDDQAGPSNRTRHKSQDEEVLPGAAPLTGASDSHVTQSVSTSPGCPNSSVLPPKDSHFLKAETSPASSALTKPRHCPDQAEISQDPGERLETERNNLNENNPGTSRVTDKNSEGIEEGACSQKEPLPSSLSSSPSSSSKPPETSFSQYQTTPSHLPPARENDNPKSNQPNKCESTKNCESCSGLQREAPASSAGSSSACSYYPEPVPGPSHTPPVRIMRFRGSSSKCKCSKSTQTLLEHQRRQQQCQATQPEIRKKVTCDIRLRVRAEYCHHESALQGNVFSNKPELLERQFEKFMQANTILKSRDLGSIICDIKFSELTYLDAFWRDYINGSLLEALKGVFITESLKQAVGHEAIKLLVNVDEDDYEAGRQLLLQNLRD